MDNRWIALLQHYGLLTRNEAEKICKDIQDSVGSASYSDADKDIKNIIADGKFPERMKLPDLEEKLKQLEQDHTLLVNDFEKYKQQVDFKQFEQKFKELQKQFVDVLATKKEKVVANSKTV